MILNDTDIVKAIEYYVERTTRRIFREEFKKLGALCTYSAIVESVNADGTVNVKLPMEEEVIQNLKNKTNQTLSAGDEVYLYSIRSLSNAFVGVAKK